MSVYLLSIFQNKENDLKSAKWENIFKGWNQSESKTVVTLKQVPVFKDFSDKEFLELEKLIHHRQYSTGDFIFKNRAPGEGMYIIMQGAVKITIGTRNNNENILAELEDENSWKKTTADNIEAHPYIASIIPLVTISLQIFIFLHL